jgi:hypothetical protein
MNVKQLKELLNQFDEDNRIVLKMLNDRYIDLENTQLLHIHSEIYKVESKSGDFSRLTENSEDVVCLSG